MNVRKYSVIPILVLLLVVVGCSSNTKNPEVSGDKGSVKPIAEPLDMDSLQSSDVQEVKLSRSLGFGVVNEAVLGMFKEEADIFIDAIKSAKKLEGKIDVRRPDYDVSFLANGDSLISIHLWLDTDIDSGMYTYISETETGYSLTEEAASTLKKLIMNLP